LSGQPSSILGYKGKDYTGFLQQRVSYDGQKPTWRPDLAALCRNLARKPHNQAMLCDVDAGPAIDEYAADLESLANTLAKDSPANRTKNM